MVAIGLELSMKVLEEAIGSGSSVGARPRRPSSFHRSFSRLDDAWRAEFGDKVERPHWAELLRSGVAIFVLDYDPILLAMYALSAGAEGDSFRCVPLDPGKEAASLGAGESSLPGIAPAEALHTFTLDSSASRCFFRDSTTLTPLPAPVPVRLADPSGGPVVARSSTVLPCPAVPSGSLSGLHLPLFSTNLVSASGQVAPPCSCRLLSHPTLLWHHRLGHPSLPRLRGMHSRLLVSGLPRSLPPLPPSPALPCLPCIEGWQRAAPHSSSFPSMIAPLQTLHMDVWGPARASGQGRERYFLLVVDDFTRYTTVFPLRIKGQVVDVLTPWIRAVRLQLHERFRQDLPQNGIAERRIGLVMEVARTSMIHAAAPHFLWQFAIRYATHQLNLWPRVSLPETSPTLHWTGKVGDVSVFRVRGSRAFVCDTSADKLSARAIPCFFVGFSPGAHGWQFYHPTSCRVFPSQDVTFDEPVPFHRLFPYRSAPPPSPPLFLAPGHPPVDPLPPQGPAPSGGAESEGAGSRGAEPGGAEPGGAEPAGVEPGGAEPRGVEPGGVEPKGVEPGGAESEGAEFGDAEPRGTALSRGPAGALPSLSPRPETFSPPQLREWLVRRARLWSGATGAKGTGDAGAGGAGVTAGAGGSGGTAAAGPGGARTRARGAGGTVRPRPYFVRLLGGSSSTGLPPLLLCPPPDQSQPPLLPASPLPAPSPYTEQTGGLTERSKPSSRPASPVCTGRRVSRPRPPPVPGTHTIALRPSSVPLRVPLPSPPESSLPAVLDPEAECARTASPTVSRLLASAVTNPSFESTPSSALVAELLDFAAASRLDYATALIAESESASPPSVGGECALGTDVLEDRQEDFECLSATIPRFASMLLAPEGDPDAPDIPTPRSYAEAIMGPYSSQWQAAMDAEMASWKSLGTYVDEIPPPGANIVDGMWIFRYSFLEGKPARGDLAAPPTWLHWVVFCRYPVEPPTASLPSLPGASRVARHTEDYTWALWFTPSTADPSLFLRTDTLLPPFYVLVFIDVLVFATAHTEALTIVKSELQKRHTCTDLGELRSYLSLQITQDKARCTVTLTPSHMVHQSVEPSGPYPELVGCLMYMMTCTRPDLAYPLNLLSRYVALGRHRKGYTFSLGSVSVSWRSTRSSSVLSSSCEAEINAGAMAAQELRWLTYVLTDLGEQPRSPPVLYVDNKAMIALCQEHSLEHRRKHIALQYFLARELQQRGQLRLAYVATRANTADIFTKALPSGDHHCFSALLGLLALLFLTGLVTTCSPPLCLWGAKAEIYAGAMAAQELCWLTFLLADLGQRPSTAPTLFAGNKAMILMCREPRLESSVKHIDVRYFLLRELQRRGLARLDFVAAEANTADIFTKALVPSDHHRFCLQFGLVDDGARFH
ncbi:unnamed protein product [Closterium sp. NIES-53]